MVELTIALHTEFESARDRLLWDTGHQSYVHKILTGRQAGFDRLRKAGGVSGYPSREESAHDLIENSHASTALSYADGLARADAHLGRRDRATVAVIGDGAMTGGMAWEALNNIAGGPQRSSVIVLNDNQRCYAPTVGGLAEHQADLRAGRGPGVFEQLELGYLGLIDGHGRSAVQHSLRHAVALGRPVVVHVITVKGKEYRHTENNDLDRGHAVKPMDPRTGQALKALPPSFTPVFGEKLVQLAEQHADTMAAGLSMGGVHPVVAIYSTFVNRALDQLLMDVALHRRPVTFVFDRSWVTGDDGPSHNGMWDLSVLQVVPGLRIAAPRDGTRLAELLAEAVAWHEGPTLVDPRWVTPVNPALADLARRHRLAITVEDNSRAGGAGSAIAQARRDADVHTPLREFGIPRRFLGHGSRAEVLAACGLSAQNITRGVAEMLTGLDVAPASAGIDDPGTWLVHSGEEH